MNSRSIDQALDDLAAIRSSLRDAETFRGYRSASVAASSLFAWAGCIVQWWQWNSPTFDLDAFLRLWIGIAFASAAVTFGEVAIRYWQSGPAMRHWTRGAIAPMLPCLAVGALLTWAIWYGAPEVGWMLPGLWSILFGLGVFASISRLPKAILLAGAHYVLIGAACIAAGPEWNFAPLWMGAAFGFGQAWCGFILYWTLERRR